MKQLFLIPPSEGKNSENIFSTESLTFLFKKPKSIATGASQKDLKCSGKRFEEAITLNTNIEKSFTNYAVNRYSGVMFKAIDYEGMNQRDQKFFEDNFLITSGMYGLVAPLDKIGNYKLPIETKGLYDYWDDKIVERLIQTEVKQIINFLPISYSRLIGANTSPKSQLQIRQKLLEHNIEIINIEFQDTNGKKLAHGVKKIKGEFIRAICQEGKFDYKKYNYIYINDMIYVPTLSD